ncbi:MAG: mechanosensitive ion channel domain-containing protein [Acidobacteriota bacterium]
MERSLAPRLTPLLAAVLGAAPVAAQDAGSDVADALGAEVDQLKHTTDWMAQGKDWLIANGPAFAVKLVVVVLILLAFSVLAGIARRLVRRILDSPRANFSQLLEDFLVAMTSRLVWILGVLVALGQLGVDIVPLLAGLGVAGFILGFAMQETLSNFAAGLMLLGYQPFDVGDVVTVGGVTGKVMDLSLVSTTILTPDNQRQVVPNSKIWGDVITNVTAEDTRRVDLVFGIGYDDDIEQAERILADIVAKHDKVLADPEPVVKLHELADSSVNFVTRPWCKTEDYWDVYWDVTREVKRRFDAEGLSIPYPQQDLHLHRVDAA